MFLVFSCSAPDVPKNVKKQPLKENSIIEFDINYVERHIEEFDRFEGKVRIHKDSIVEFIDNNNNIEIIRIIKTLSVDTFNVFIDSNLVLNTYQKILCLQQNTNKMLPDNSMQQTVSFATSGEQLLYLIVSPLAGNNYGVGRTVRYYQTIEEEKSGGKIKNKYYTVKKGDTWASIALSNNVSEQILKQYNPGKSVPSGILMIP